MGRLILVTAFCIMAGCASAPKGGFCSIAEPIRLSEQAIDAMSDAEITKALEHNERGARLCGWKP